MGSWRGMDLALDESETDSSNAAAAQSIGSALLFFGARTREHDFLYASDWLEFLNAGALTELFTAFSRDESKGQEKVYVQTRMREHGQRLCALLTDSACPAHVFVCGDGAVMEKDTQTALIDILQQHAGMSLDEAKAFFVKMLADKRYVADVWS
jgi:sulfite reductase (NADPH) flavoprotein alpha-component